MEKGRRLLSDIRHADRFLRDVLSLEEKQNDIEIDRWAMKISSVEIQLSNILGKDTMSSADYRVHSYLTDTSRKKLRMQIYDELIHKKRLDNDDDIVLGKGGVLPKTSIQHNKQAFYVIGLPASGKSGIVTSLSDKYGALILDSDFAKRKFPEYENDVGASLVHEESSLVIFGGTGRYAREKSVLQFAVENECNIVIPKIGDKADKVLSLSKELKRVGYEVHLILARLDRKYATERALERFIKTKRYVPLSLIFDGYGNDPTITFYDMKQFESDFKSFTMISTEVPLGNPKKLQISSQYSPEIDL